MTKRLLLLELGTVAYEPAWDLQRRLVAARADGHVEDVLILLEHPHTYTLGRHSPEAHVLLDADGLAQIDATLYRSDRGGDVTYHGPGQIVGYPILDLRERGRDIHDYVRKIEQVLIDTLAELGVSGGRIAGLSGVWVGEEKVASIGVRVTRWVTSHGFALNVNADLRYFEHIIPCGIRGKGVTSLQRLRGREVDERLVRTRLQQQFAALFDYTIEPIELARLDGAIEARAPGARSGRGNVTSFSVNEH